MDVFKPEIIQITDELRDLAAPIIARQAFKGTDVRPLEVITNHTYEGLAIELALRIKGFIRNPNKFDPSNPETYAWDVSFGDKRFEVKRMIKRKNDNFLSYNRLSFKRFERDQNLVDGFIGGLVSKNGSNGYKIKIVLICPPEILFKYSVETKFQEVYGEHNFYFDHPTAQRFEADQFVINI